jgi:signal transduction histidine kinase/ActR/RegA family two-component response regulator
MMTGRADSPERIQALERYEILDTPPEEEFDDITRLIARICEVPVAMITLVDRDRQWFKSEIGLGLRQTSLETSICAHAILQPGLFIVPDTLMDPRFTDNPLVSGWPHLRFYAGARLETSDGHALGTLCVLDYKPRGLLDAQKEALRTLAHHVMILLELRRNLKLIDKAKQTAEAADHAKDQFLATLSHELRTPLAPVLMTSYSLLLDETLTKSQRADVEIIRSNVELEIKMIEDLLDLTRIAHGKFELRLEPADVHRLLDRAEQVARGGGTSVPIEKVFRATASCVRGDEARLQQAFWNVLKNAIKFTPPTGCIAIITSNPRPDLIRIRIIDTGLGIEPEMLPRLFSQFEQGRRDFVERFGGLGLGLSITRGILNLHDGSIEASSPGRNKGATFTIDLPVVPTTVTPLSSIPQKIEPAANSLRILLVEDHEATAQIIARLLRRAGHEADTAASVASAKSLFDRREFDLVISDLGLPDGNGLDLMRYINERRPTEAIALSGYGMKNDIEASQAAGFREHLIKPVDWPKLEAAVTRSMSRLRPTRRDNGEHVPLRLFRPDEDIAV